jgi:hypothetical protein
MSLNKFNVRRPNYCLAMRIEVVSNPLHQRLRRSEEFFLLRLRDRHI